MKQLDLEVLNNQFVEFWSNMMDAGLDSYYNPDELRQILCASAAGTSEESGLAYPGALLVHINLVTSIAKRLKQMISGTFNINDQSLIKVCCLMHLSKAVMFKPNDNEWEINNRGMNYKFAEVDGRLKAGERSIMYAIRSGIQFNAFEYEAMVCLDRENEEKGAKMFDCPMTTVIRQANELATMIEKERYRKENNK